MCVFAVDPKTKKLTYLDQTEVVKCVKRLETSHTHSANVSLVQGHQLAFLHQTTVTYVLSNSHASSQCQQIALCHSQAQLLMCISQVQEFRFNVYQKDASQCALAS